MPKQKGSKSQHIIRPWSAINLNRDTLHHIISFLYVNRDYSDEVTNIITSKCREALANVYLLRSVCIMFHDVIEESQTLWQALARNTRRSLIHPTPLECHMPNLLDTKALKEFIAMDEREYKERNTLALMRDYNEYGCYIFHAYRGDLDYTKAVLQRYTTAKDLGLYQIKVKVAYDKRLGNYRKMVNRMDKLCGNKSRNERMSTRCIKMATKQNKKAQKIRRCMSVKKMIAANKKKAVK